MPIDYSSENSSLPKTLPSQNISSVMDKKLYKKPTSFSQRLTGVFRNIGILTVLALLIVSSMFAFVLLDRDNAFSQFVVNKTPIHALFNLPSTNTTTVTQNSNDKPVNNFFGLNPDATTNVSTEEVVQQVLPSVLSISVRDTSTSSALSTYTAGTGYIADKNGLVVTNKHVIAQKCQPGSSQVKITGLTQDDKAYELKLLSIDPVNDIAILQIQGGGTFTPITFADSDKLTLGSDVIAIGNALGELQNTVTKGIISGLNRSLSDSITDECTQKPVNTDGLIQTDAAINKGNSGGPLFNQAGQLVGMNTFGTSDAQNIGLAIPSDLIVTAIQSYQKNNKVVRPRLGIYTKSLTAIEKSELTWLPVDYGEIIFAPQGELAISANSAAQQAGLKEGDIITEINGQKIQSTSENPSPLKRTLLTLQAGDKVDLTVIKATGGNSNAFQYSNSPTKITVTLGSNSFDLPNN